MEFLSLFNFIIGVLFFICYTYQFAYLFVPFFKKDKPHKQTKPHRYAVLISARNEEKVLPQLLKSLQEQTYDMSLVTIFVVADNCTDATAEVALPKAPEEDEGSSLAEVESFETEKEDEE